jgi:hypothetical protein
MAASESEKAWPLWWMPEDFRVEGLLPVADEEAYPIPLGQHNALEWNQIFSVCPSICVSGWLWELCDE